MANPAIRGQAVVFGATGSITLAGTAILSSNKSLSLTNADVTQELTGSTGKVNTVINVEDIIDIEGEIVPNGTDASTLAKVKLACAMIRKNDAIIIGSADIASYNATYRMMEFSVHNVSDNAVTLRFKARKNEADFSGAALSA